MFKRRIDFVYEKLLDKYSKIIDEIDKHSGRKCVCAKYCSGCCNQLIIITDIEKELLRYTIKKLDEKTKAYVIDRAKESCHKLIENHLDRRYVSPYVSDKEQAEIQKRYFDLKIQCPFLYRGECLIYNRRQISCMTYRNYGFRSDCFKSPFVEKALTFDGVERAFRDEFFKKTKIYPKGFNILPFAILEVCDIPLEYPDNL